MLNTFHLRTFLAVVDTGSYSAAALALHMTQPAVSQQIRALEEQLGEIKLFRRVGKRMVPTHAGEELLGSARDLVQLAERAEQNILALKGQVAGRVVVGCTANSGERLLPRLLADFHTRFPAVHLELLIAPADTLLDALGEREIAMIVLEEQQRRRGLDIVALGSEPLVVIGATGNPLLKQAQVPPGILREQPLILPRQGSPLRRTIEEGLRKRSVLPADLHPVLETDSITGVLQSVRAGLGLAFVPKICLPSRSDGIGTIDLAGQALHQDWFLIRMRERGQPRAVQELYDYMLSPVARTILSKAGLT
ncbi:MAG: LysR family transcriptional regulator [Chloroflexia bacterium]|nr:LysR family transcriptional regulator [Chloroflexia bacterium]